jgi:GntR family transcriptional regulator
MSIRPAKPFNLPITPVDPSSPVPLYHQVEVDLQTLMNSAVLAANDVLPPETELCKLYGVGRQTIRMALSRLVTHGMIARQAGRGTFILPQPDRAHFYLDRSFTRQMSEMGMTTRSDVLQTSSGIVGANAPRALRDRQGAAYFQLVRLRYGDDQPIGLHTTTILTDRCAGIEGYDFARESLYDVLSRDYQLAIAEIAHTISAVVADGKQADSLRVHIGDPLLQVNTTAYLDGHEVIEFTVAYYRADKYEYSTTHVY